MGPLRTCAWIGMLVVPIACRTAGGSRVSRLDEDEGRSRASAPSIEPVALGEVEPEYLAALETVQAAVRTGDDATARRILDRVLWRGPSGKTLAVARAFERVLDGRAAVRELELVLEARPEVSDADSESSGSSRREGDAPDADAGGGADAARSSARPALSSLWLVARNQGDVPLVLAPGPATLVTTHQRLDARAGLASSSEAHGFETLRELAVAPGGEARVRLSAFFLAPAEGALAERFDFRLELRAGAIRRDGRELPAQRVPVRDLEVVALSEPLIARGAARGEDLEALVRAGRVATSATLELALRIPSAERGAAFDRVARAAVELAEPDLCELVPALRWLAPDVDPGTDPEAWRAVLRTRARGVEKAGRGNLVLPPGG